MSFTYYICPYCRVATFNSYIGREYRYCNQCGHTFDLDDTEAVTVGQSHTGDETASHCQRHTGVGPSTARSGGTS